jgi:hypothetical protein
MNLQDLLDTCAQSDPSDWQTIPCQSGPSFLDQFDAQPGEHGLQLRHQAHHMRAAYKPDVCLALAWGIDPDNIPPDETRFQKAPWSKAFPAAPEWTTLLADVLYCGTLVHRESCADVDGARCYLPVPRRSKTGEFTVSQWSHDFVRLLDRLERSPGSEFDRYFQDAGFTIAD